jgi:hypothetical protein
VTSIDTPAAVVGRLSQQPFHHAPGMAAMRLLFALLTIALQSLRCTRRFKLVH